MSDLKNAGNERPVARTARVLAVLWASAFLVSGAAMILWPDLFTDGTGRADTILWKLQHPKSWAGKLLAWIWGWPLGVFFVLLCPISLWYEFSKARLKNAGRP